MSTTLLIATTLLAGTVEPDTSVRLARGATVEIASAACTVDVRVGAEERLIVTGGEVEVSGSSAEVHCAPGLRGRRGSGTLSVTLPPGARVEVSAASGDITFAGATERLEISTMSGRITLAGGGGRVALETVAGMITVTDFRGTTLNVEAMAGEITVNGAEASERVSAESVSGSVRLRDIRAGTVRASTVNGALDFGGALDRDGSYSFETHNGAITLTLPRDASARMKVATVLGQFETALEGTIPGSGRTPPAPPAGGRAGAPVPPAPPMFGEREFTVVYGKGEARISVESFNGAIRVRAAPR